ncbi:MAG: hypothetical protein LAT51_11495, partial [Flavobacteriaceae bacterium]|nr:hypothetical protein [Flavobacteriaceae bacterium]
MKYIYLLIFIILSTTLLAQGAIETPTIGDGTTSNPYEISTYGHLRWISETDQTETATWTFHYIQTADIDASDSDSGLGFTPIASSIQGGINNVFSGEYNGNSFSISNLIISRTSQNFIGLFSTIVGDVYDLEIIDANITGGSSTGILAGEIRTSSSFESTGEVNNIIITNGSVNSTGNNIGGLAGSLNNGIIRNSSSSATVGSGSRTGGLVGSFSNPLGSNGLIEKSFATGNVSGNDEVGGLIGRQTNSSTVTRNAYARGDVSGVTNVGGFIGNYVTGTIENSYAANTVSISNGSEVAAGFGNETGTGVASACFFDADLTSTDNSSATGETSPNMQDEDTFLTAGWDFVCETENGNEFIWNIDASINDAYPNLEGEDSILPEAIEPDGNGTPETPYLITSLENLYWITTTPTSWDANFEQINDIDASATEDWGCLEDEIGWITIANDTNESFSGVYDGGGFAIENLFIDADASNVGLFGNLSGTVSDLKLNNFSVSASSNIGALAGTLEENAEINSVFINDGTLTSNATGASNIGGVVGEMEGGLIRVSFSTANVNGDQNVGGFVGLVTGGQINNAYARGNVSGVSATGGFAGSITDGLIDKSYAANTVSASDASEDPAGFANQTGTNLITNSFYDSELVSTDASDASGKTTLEMNTITTFTDIAGEDNGWDFVCETENGSEDIWRILSTENNSYPFFDDEFESPDLTPEGEGTEANPYEIANLGNLIWLANNDEEWDKFYIQVANIDLSETLEFECPGENDSFQIIAQLDTEAFTGNYNGQEFSIQNLTLSEAGNRIGFFGTLDGATLENLEFTSANVTGNSNVGVLAGIALNSTISDVTIDGAIAQNEETGLENIGGLAGTIEDSVLSSITIDIDLSSEGINSGGVAGSVNNSTLTDLSVAGNIAGNNQTGGVAGFIENETSIDEANVSAVISASDNSVDIGGIVGQLISSSVANSSLTTAINLSIVSNLGGIAGNSTNSEITENTNSAEITGANFVGGIVGVGSSTDLIQNTNELAVTGTDQVGGIAGNLSGTEYSFTSNTNEVSITGGLNIGGLVGLLEGSIENIESLSNSGNVIGTTNVGGLFGSIDATVTLNELSVEDINITGENSVGGLIGFTGENVTINQSFVANININGDIGNSVGGLIGENNADVSQSYVQNFSMNYTTSLTNAGGFVGILNAGSIEDNYVLSPGSTSFSQLSVLYVGGFVGQINDTGNANINRAYAAVNMPAAISGFAGLLNTSDISNSFWNIDLVDGSIINSDISATATSTEDMQLEITYTTASWDFECEDANGSEYIWGINPEDNEEYPFLRWQGFESECDFEDGTWTGDVSTDWADADNWQGGIPEEGDNISIPNVTNLPELDTDRIVGTVQIATDAYIDLNDNRLTIQGNVLGGGSFIGSKTSSLNFTTGGSINLSLNQNENESSNILGQLLINRSGASISLNNRTLIADFVRITSGNLNTNDNLVFYCDWNNNAKVGLMDRLGSDGSISGTVTSEQCFRARRAFRFIAPSINMTQTIRNSWQEGANAWDDNPNEGYGIHITGLGQENQEPTNDGQNGLDWQPSGNPSMFTWTGTSWNAVTNTETTLSSGQARRVMVRGGRDVDIRFNDSPPTPTKIRTVGNIRIVNVDVETNTPNGQLTFRGNPYQSLLDLSKLFDDSNGIESYAYYWDPMLGGENPVPGEPGGRGAWVAYWLDDENNFQTIGFDGEENELLGPASGYLQPMQGVFLRASNDNPTISFREEHIVVDE